MKARPPASSAKPKSALTGRLHKLGIYNDADLLLHLPMRYEDETRVSLIGEARPGEPLQIEAEVEHAEVTFKPRRQLVARVRDASGSLYLRFINF